MPCCIAEPASFFLFLFIFIFNFIFLNALLHFWTSNIRTLLEEGGTLVQHMIPWYLDVKYVWIRLTANHNCLLIYYVVCATVASLIIWYTQNWRIEIGRPASVIVYLTNSKNPSRSLDYLMIFFFVCMIVQRKWLGALIRYLGNV